MELHQLRYFLAVVDEGTFTAAADAVQVSQSGISTQVQKLERELGVTLIDRSTRHVSVTPAGSHLLPYARAVITAVEDVRGAAGDLRGLAVGSLRVGTVIGLDWPPLFDALADVHSRYPGIDLRLDEANSDDLIAGVRAGTLDVAVAAWSDHAPEDLEVSVVVDDPLVATLPPDHRWSRRTRLRPSEIAGTDLIALPRGTGARSALDALLARIGAGGNPRWEVATPAYVRLLAGRGLGVGIVSATTAAAWSDLVRLRIDDRAARSRLGIVWRRRPSHATRALLRVLPSTQAG